MKALNNSSADRSAVSSSQSSSSCSAEHGHHCCHGGAGHIERADIMRLAGALLLSIIAYTFSGPDLWRIVMFVVAWLLAGSEVLEEALHNWRQGKWFDENALMTIASIGAFAVKEYPEAVAVMVFYSVGEMLQNYALNRSRANIVKLMDLRPDQANLEKAEGVIAVSPEQVALGDIIVIKPGEKVPLDGVIISGASQLDTKSLTGESLPRDVAPDDEALTGMVNLSGVLRVRVTKIWSESTAAKIIKLVEEAGEKKSESEKFITRFARIYTPTVVGIAALTAVLPPLSGLGSFAVWVYRALCFLIISCPCALVLSIPLSIFGGIGGAARNGALVKGGRHLELLEKLGSVVFDKTGTLTEGAFTVTSVEPVANCAEAEVINIAAALEAHSNHPLAQAITANVADGSQLEASDLQEHPGRGLQARVGGEIVRVGTVAWVQEAGCIDIPTFAQTAVYVARGTQYLGAILLSDRLKASTSAALKDMRALGIDSLSMLTGDKQAIAADIADRAGLDNFEAELLPTAKVAALERIMAGTEPGKFTAFVGDGINDAPVLARADLGIAMGGGGSDAAIEAADVVLLRDELSDLVTAIRVAHKTKSIVKQNIGLALGVKIAVMVLAAAGLTSVWAAIFADVGVALLALANAGRALYVSAPTSSYK